MASPPLEQWARSVITAAMQRDQARQAETLWESYAAADPVSREALFMVLALDFVALRTILKARSR